MTESKYLKTLPTAVLVSILSALSASSASAEIPKLDTVFVNPGLLDATVNTLSRLPAEKFRQLQTNFMTEIELIDSGTTTRRHLFVASSADSTQNPGRPPAVISCYINCYDNCHSDCGGNDI